MTAGEGPRAAGKGPGRPEGGPQAVAGRRSTAAGGRSTRFRGNPPLKAGVTAPPPNFELGQGTDPTARPPPQLSPDNPYLSMMDKCTGCPRIGVTPYHDLHFARLVAV